MGGKEGRSGRKGFLRKIGDSLSSSSDYGQSGQKKGRPGVVSREGIPLPKKKKKKRKKEKGGGKKFGVGCGGQGSWHGEKTR